MVAAATQLINGTTPWPGVWTLLPVVGTLLLMAAGESGAANPITSLLATRPMVKIGDWSYSIYLWHWPFIVFAATLWPTVGWAKTLAAGLSIIPALLSYHFVENPIRHNSTILGRKLVAAIALALIPSIGAAGFLGLGSRNAWWSDQVSSFRQAVLPPHVGYASGCADFSPMGAKPGCVWNESGTGEPVYLVGDSNADHFTEGLIDASVELDRPFITGTANGCPFNDITLVDTRPQNAPVGAMCRSYMDGSLEWFAQATPGTVIISNTDLYMRRDHFKIVTSDGVEHADYAEKRELFQTALTKTITELESYGHSVIVVLNVPLWHAQNWQPSQCTNLAVLTGDCSTSMTVDEALTFHGPSRAVVQAAAEATHATVWDSWPFICQDGLCSTQHGSLVLYKDVGHISVPASHGLAPTFIELLR